MRKSAVEGLPCLHSVVSLWLWKAKANQDICFRNATLKHAITLNLHGTMPDTPNMQDTVELTYERYRHINEGEVANYIPELSKADPNDFAICVATVDGQVFCAGDWEKEFTIQSICKPFAFQLA